jgi:hypothetical protein
VTWRRDIPEGRVWALVLPKGYTVPLVLQFEPRSESWRGYGLPYTWRPCEVEWAPLPYHRRFDARTHAMEPERSE